MLAADSASSFNDDKVGRALHRLFRADRAALLTDIAIRAIEEFFLNTDHLHNDSTSVKLFGRYEHAAPKAVKPKHGQSKAIAPISSSSCSVSRYAAMEQYRFTLSPGMGTLLMTRPISRIGWR